MTAAQLRDALEQEIARLADEIEECDRRIASIEDDQGNLEFQRGLLAERLARLEAEPEDAEIDMPEKPTPAMRRIAAEPKADWGWEQWQAANQRYERAAMTAAVSQP